MSEATEFRLKKIEETLDTILEKVSNLPLIEHQVKDLNKKYCKMDLRVDELEKAPAKKYDSFKTHFITALISAGVSGLVVHYFQNLFG